MTGKYEFLRPQTRPTLLQLVRDSGVDVSDWANYKGGPKRAAANPKYCYQWSFYETEKVVVVSVWHGQLKSSAASIEIRDNLRKTARFYAGVKGRGLWALRAASFDRHIREAAQRGLPVRAIICDGERRAKYDLQARASVVRARVLDPVPWAVTSYDSTSGKFVLSRGALPSLLVDQFSTAGATDSPTETKSVTGEVFLRDPAVRKHALARANGRCEWCGTLGFTTDRGAIFLETHHVVPLSENGSDTIRNVVALCPSHHREAHYGSARSSMRDLLLKHLVS